MVKCCGNCINWTKVKSIIGLCERYDLGWCPSDHGKGCVGWRKLPPKGRVKIDIKNIDIS
jgi:hypothetical protein